MAKQNIALTADSVVFYTEKDRVKILLVQRKNDPYKDFWALPGGFLEDEEPLEAGAKRELEEETGLEVGKCEQIRAFGIPDRDPRGRTVSIGFWTEVNSEEEVKGADDAADARWFDMTDLPKLAFDHKLIVEEAFDRYISKKTN